MSVLTERLGACYTSAVHDVMVAQGMDDFVLPRTIRPLLPGRRLAGPVWTVSGRRHENIAPHDTYLSWTKLLGSVPGGHVLVCQPNDDALAHMGELSAETLQSRGTLGYIVDGGCRDVGFIQQRSFPVYCRYATPTDIVGRWLPERAGDPIAIGDVAIACGDWVLADDDGIVVLPADRAEAIVTATETVMAAENQVRDAIRAGMDPQVAYLKHRKF
jgi:4-hydroxy-4-methyl-2-oxoglutarate aldolase